MPEQSPTEPIFLSDNLSHQRHYLQLILGAIPVGVVVVDKKLLIQAFNPAAEKITGIAAEAAIGRPYGQVLKTKDKPVTDPLEEALATGQTFVNQRFYLRDPAAAETDSLPIRHSASVLTDTAGQVTGGVTIFADISPQVALEQRLKGQRRYLSDVLRSIPDGVVTTNAQLLIQSWNEAAAKMTGHPPSKVLGRPATEVLGPVISTALETVIHHQQQDDILDQQIRLPLANGQSLPVSFSAGSIDIPEDGQVRGGLVIFKDVSDRLARQRELDRQRRYLSQVLNLAPDGIFTVDQDLTIQTFNRAAEKLTGFAASFAIGKPYQEIFKLEPEAGPDPLAQLSAADMEQTEGRQSLVDAGGKKIPIRYSAASLTDTDDHLRGAIAIFQDISDIVAAERTKNEFISMVSHELRTPLTSIKGFVTAVLDGRAGELNDKQKRFLSISREQSTQLLNLINDLLDLSRLESGRIELDLSRIAVGQLLQQAVELIAPLAQRKQLSIELDVADNLPYLWADESKILQILQNLLSNSVKYTPVEGQVALKAGLADETTLLLTVTDNGIGIAPEEVARIFDPFYQVENIQTRQVGGTGLGLAIVRNIVEAHNGRIEVESNQGAGSTFRIYLPLSKKSKPTIRVRTEEPVTVVEKPAPERPPQLTRADSSRLNPLILVVDDDSATSALIQFTLEDAGYDIIAAANGREALELAAARQPNLITLDILMPEMDGFHVLDLLKKDPDTADIPVCIVSIIEDKVKGYRLGAIDYISKPFESEQLLSAVNSILKPLPAGETPQILIVEDDPHVIELVELTMTAETYEIITAYDGVTGLERLRRDQPTLVLLDIMIPKIDGYEFIRQAKSDPHTANIPIIVLSVRSLEEDINRALRLGAEKYLTKPPDDEQELSQVIQQVVKEVMDDDE